MVPSFKLVKVERSTFEIVEDCSQKRGPPPSSYHERPVESQRASLKKEPARVIDSKQAAQAYGGLLVVSYGKKDACWFSKVAPTLGTNIKQGGHGF